MTHTRLVPSAVITMSFALDVQVGREPGPPGAIVVLPERLFMERLIFILGCWRGDYGGSHEAYSSWNSNHGSNRSFAYSLWAEHELFRH